MFVAIPFVVSIAVVAAFRIPQTVPMTLCALVGWWFALRRAPRPWGIRVAFLGTLAVFIFSAVQVKLL